MTGVVDVVLAAGAGRRMGITKGLLPFRGQPLVRHVLEVVKASRVDDALVVVGADAEQVAAVVEAAGGRAVVNPRWREGQTSSIKAGLRALPHDCAAFLIHPVDHAFVEPEDLNALITAWENHPQPSAAIFRPYYGRHYGHPVLFGNRYRASFLALDDEEPGHLVYRHHQEAVLLVPVANPRIAQDLDRPEDLGGLARS